MNLRAAENVSILTVEWERRADFQPVSIDVSMEDLLQMVMNQNFVPVIDAFNRHWVDAWLRKNWVNSQKTPVKDPDLWKRLLKAKEPHRATFIWVKGHDGHPQNERCDELATSAADGEDLMEDDGRPS